MANVKVFADRQTDRQTDKQTDGQAKNYMPPIYRYGGIKIPFVVKILISQHIQTNKLDPTRTP
jgi:hypothetical protein